MLLFSYQTPDVACAPGIKCKLVIMIHKQIAIMHSFSTFMDYTILILVMDTDPSDMHKIVCERAWDEFNRIDSF